MYTFIYKYAYIRTPAHRFHQYTIYNISMDVINIYGHTHTHTHSLSHTHTHTHTHDYILAGMESILGNFVISPLSEANELNARAWASTLLLRASVVRDIYITRLDCVNIQYFFLSWWYECARMGKHFTLGCLCGSWHFNDSPRLRTYFLIRFQLVIWPRAHGQKHFTAMFLCGLWHINDSPRLRTYFLICFQLVIWPRAHGQKHFTATFLCGSWHINDSPRLRDI